MLIHIRQRRGAGRTVARHGRILFYSWSDEEPLVSFRPRGRCRAVRSVWASAAALAAPTIPSYQSILTLSIELGDLLERVTSAARSQGRDRACDQTPPQFCIPGEACSFGFTVRHIRGI